MRPALGVLTEHHREQHSGSENAQRDRTATQFVPLKVVPDGKEGQSRCCGEANE
ncbi:hypothetical protein GCM10018966_065510 [Streptomyces yanii]